jgi:hypothetical protein
LTRLRYRKGSWFGRAAALLFLAAMILGARAGYLLLLRFVFHFATTAATGLSVVDAEDLRLCLLTYHIAVIAGKKKPPNFVLLASSTTTTTTI